MTDLRHGDVTEAVIRAFYDVYNELGYGFLECVYRKALALEMRRRHFAIVVEAPIDVWYRGEVVGHYVADLLVANRVVVELKAGRVIAEAHRAQLFNYLRATRIEVGLLLHFGPRPKFERLFLSAPSF